MNDELTLVGARTKYGTQLHVYDDGFGPVWLYREADGLTGVVRARTWESAYEICQDEIMTLVPEDEVHEAYGLYTITHNNKIYLCPDMELPSTVTRWESFNNEIPGRVVIGWFNTMHQVRRACERIIEDNELDLIDGYEYQPNATGTGIVSTCLNGQELEPLTADLRSELGITLQVTQD